ncbi:FtsX-like permease family protein [Enterococcus sp. AZ102]|uniref:FtsX-like permease family protein n=1 Tax=Enterococcus sp. AZ102 TaxID=2774865 RepID=UPI003F1FF53E
MLVKILLRSFFKQLKSYFVYFLCMSTSVMIFYSFSAINYDQPLILSVKQDVQISGSLVIGNIIVAVIVLIFTLSANRFFLNKRRNEMGLYRLFGMQKRQIISVFLIETMFLNLISLIIGIFEGILFSKLFSMMLVKAMDLNIESRFFISLTSVVLTVAVFMIALILIVLQDILLIRRNQLSELFQTTKQELTFQTSIHWTRLVLGVMGVLCIVLGYSFSFLFIPSLRRYIVATNDYTAIFWFPLLIILLCSIGTYFFFAYTLPAILFYLSRLTGIRTNGLTSFLLSNTRLHLHKSWKTFSFITVVLGLSTFLIGGILGIFSLTYNLVELSNPTTFQVIPQQVNQLENLIQQANGKITVKKELTYKLTAFHLQQTNLFDDDLYSKVELVNLIPLSAYQQLNEIVGYFPEVTLDHDQEAVYFYQNYLVDGRLVSTDHHVELEDGSKLKIKKIYTDVFGEPRMRYTNNLLVVSDEVFSHYQGLENKITYINATGYNKSVMEHLISSRIDETWNDPIYYTYSYDENGIDGQITKEKPIGVTIEQDLLSISGEKSRLNFKDRYAAVRAARRTLGLEVYIFVFIGVTILISTASSLLVRQFTLVEKERKTYQLLRNIGIDQHMIRKVIYYRNALILGPISILATLHGIVAVHVIRTLIHGTNYWIVYLFAILSVIIYIIVYIVCSLVSIRMTEEQH